MTDLLADLLTVTAPLMRPAFHLLGGDVSGLELVAVVLAVAMVLCNLRVNPLGWPLAIASSALYALLFARSRLYGEAALQLVFIALSAWGWWQWLRGTGEAGQPLRVHRLDGRHKAIALGLTLAAWPLLGSLLARHTNSEVPYLDALATTGSITGTLLLGRKLIENWPVWVLVNLFSVGLFASRGWWLTVLLYAVFTVMALAGWQAWHRQARAAAVGAQVAP